MKRATLALTSGRGKRQLQYHQDSVQFALLGPNGGFPVPGTEIGGVPGGAGAGVVFSPPLHPVPHGVFDLHTTSYLMSQTPGLVWPGGQGVPGVGT